MAKPKRDQLHIRMDPELHERFYFWCIHRHRTMTEICHLCIRAVLDGRIQIEPLEQETTDDRQGTYDR